MPPPETYKSEIGSQSTVCQVQAGAYVSLLTPGGTKYSDCHPSKTTTYILHVVSITTHTHDRHKSIGEKETKERKEDEGKERKEKKNETKRKRQRDIVIYMRVPPSVCLCFSLGYSSAPG